MTRAERIYRALGVLEGRGLVKDFYCHTGMPGRRWIVWGTANGVTYERSLDTKAIEEFIEELSQTRSV